MNCKPGDLAVVVRAFVPANLGIFVTVLKPLGQLRKGQRFIHEGRCCVADIDDFYWWIESSSLLTISGLLCRAYKSHASDSQLRPIRDNPGNESWFKAAPIKTTELV